MLPRFRHGATRMNMLLPGFGGFGCWRFAPSACIAAGPNRSASFQTSVHFPSYHQRLKPYIFSEAEVAKLLRAAAGLERKPVSPLRPEVIRLAIVLLFTTGIRRGELLSLTLGDYNRGNRLCTFARRSSINRVCFRSMAALPMRSIAICALEPSRNFPFPPDTALIWNASWGGRAYSGTSLRLCLRPLLQKCGIVTPKGKLPRIHDFRHSFAVNALLRWYRGRCRCRGQSCPCWPPTWGTVRQYRRITTCTSSNHSAPRPANGSRIITVNWSPHCRKQQGGADEDRASESTRRCNPRLLHGSPSPPSGNQSAHHP